MHDILPSSMRATVIPMFHALIVLPYHSPPYSISGILIIHAWYPPFLYESYRYSYVPCYYCPTIQLLMLSLLSLYLCVCVMCMISIKAHQRVKEFYKAMGNEGDHCTSALSYPALSYPVLSCPTLPYPTLPSLYHVALSCYFIYCTIPSCAYLSITLMWLLVLLIRLLCNMQFFLWPFSRMNYFFLHLHFFTSCPPSRLHSLFSSFPISVLFLLLCQSHHSPLTTSLSWQAQRLYLTMWMPRH